MRILSSRHPAIKGWWSLLVLMPLLSAPVFARPSNFGTLSLAPGKAAKNVKGYAKGAVALHKIVGDRDRNNNRCMGYGSPSPDHLLVLQKNFSRLQFQVNSGKDTTLLLKGPDNKLYCVDDSSKGKDAGFVAKNLKAGSYKVWIGTFDLGDNYRYTLSVTD